MAVSVILIKNGFAKKDTESEGEKTAKFESSVPRDDKTTKSEDSVSGQADRQGGVILDVPYISQNERYPTGCESVSTVMALNYLNINISPDEFIDKYLDKGAFPDRGEDGVAFGCDPWKAFPGDPYTNRGYGCFAPVVIKALNKFIDKDKYEIFELYDVQVSELCSRFIDRDIPVVFWATADMKPTRTGNSWTEKETGNKINWISPMHCLLLVGYDEDFYYFNDPQRSKAHAYEKGSVETAYEAMHSQAVAIAKKIVL